MEKITLEVEKREVLGKAVKHLRKEGIVPAVIHDHGKVSTHVMAPYMLLNKAYAQAGKHHPVTLKVGSKTYTALIKDATFEPRKNQLTHVVFNAVKADEKVDAEIPLHVKYDEGNESSPAERAGLVVLHQLDTVEVEALPGDLPDAIEYDGEKLIAAGDQITVASLIVPKGVVVKTEPEHVVATVFEPSALEAANNAAGGEAEAATPATEANETSPETSAEKPAE